MTASVKQDRFSNVNLLYSIQDKYQTNQDQSFHSNQSNLSTTGNYNALKSLSMLPPPSMGMATNSDVGTKNDMGSVSWYNNPKKKSNLHNNLSKRSLLLRSTGNEDKSETSSGIHLKNNGFNLADFSKKDSSDLLQKKDNLGATDIYNSTTDYPPTTSLHDWQREDEFGIVQPASNTSNYGEPNSKSYHNNSYGGLIKTPNVFDKSGQSSGYKLSSTIGKNNTDVNKNDNNSAIYSESAVIVFGYPEYLSNQVITHFSHFGNILEDFEILRSSTGINNNTFRLHANLNALQEGSMSTKLPIFTGEGWVKITYDSPTSALRALKENGTVFTGHLIGCIPYSKSAVEQLASISVDKSDDIGSIDLGQINKSVNEDSRNKGSNGKVYPSLGSVDHIEPINGRQKEANMKSFGTPIINNNQQYLDHSIMAHPRHKLDIQDGKSLFVHNSSHHKTQFLDNIEKKIKEKEANKNESGSWSGRLTNWVFGWDNI